MITTRTLRPCAALLALVLLAACAREEHGGIPDEAAAALSEREITLQTSDGVTVWADLHRGGGVRPLILLFHQGGASARAEYGHHIPLLLERGYDVLAVDARAGGDRFGGVNRTVSGFGEVEPSYCDAAPDLAAALDYALELEGVRGLPVLWGSSYSAALALRLAAQRSNDVAGVLAFSPASGDPMAGCLAEEMVGALSVPALALRPENEAAIPSVAAQTSTLSAAGLETYVSSPGAHGSSMLHPERVDGDVAPTWAVVDDFLGRVRSGPGG
jgi:pimeloyl-ACP methyl ester carboxylesterase